MAMKSGIVKQLSGVTFTGKADSNHWVVMDGPEEFGGSNAGVRPKELILLGLAGCTASDVAVILKKKRIETEGFEVKIRAEMKETHPQVYTRINLEYLFYGKGIPADAVERAIELSQKSYCSVTAMLKDSVEITHSFSIIDKET